MLQRNSFEPNVYFRPDHLLIKLSMIFYSIISFIIYQAPAEQVATYNIALFYLISRIITAFFGIGTIILAYLIGAKVNSWVGIIASFLFAFFPSFVTHSCYVTPDIPTAFFLMLFILFAIRYMHSPTYKELLLMCLSTSAFIAIKYPGAILCIFIAISVTVSSVVDKNYKRFFSHGMIAVVSVLFFLFAISPVLFTNITAVMKAIESESRATHLGADGLGWIGNMIYYTHSYLLFSGVLLFVFLVIGIFYLCKKRADYRLVPVFYSFIYWVVLSYMPLHWERWAVPMYASPLIISAVGIHYSFIFLKSRFSMSIFKRYLTIYYITIFIIALNFLTGSFSNLMDFITPDTRVASVEYARSNNITRENSISEGYTTLLQSGPANLSGFVEIDGVYYLKNRNIKNILLSSSMYSRYKAEPERYRSQISLYNSLDRHYSLENTFISAKRDRSVVDILNIINSVSYINNVRELNFAGPDLLFYAVGEDNYVIYNLSDEILFDRQNRNYHRYYMSGLHSSEDEGAWTSGESVEFLVNIDRYLDINDVVLYFEVYPIVEQNVEVYINSQLIDTLKITEDNVYSVAIDSAVIESGDMHIRFIMDSVISPKELGISEDDRTLGLFFRRMWISEAM